jgi:hypothetical protein
MAVGVSQAKTDPKRAAIAIPPQPKGEGLIFSFIERNQFAVMASPICLAVIMIILNMFAGQRVHAVIDFMTSIPQK